MIQRTFTDAVENLLRRFNEADDVAVLIHLSPANGQTDISSINIDREATIFLLGKLHQKLQLEFSAPVKCQAVPNYFNRQ